jgi:protein SPT2
VPPKGSYADIMARARLAQEQKGQNHVGMIMHQAASKEKASKMGPKRREEDEKAKHGKIKPTKVGVDNGRIRKRSTSPTKKANEARMIKPPRPPLAAPASTYKGTMGQPAQRPPISARSRGKDGRRSSKFDEYLGTDEEDEVDDDEIEDEIEGEGNGSDVSSEMEAGAFDIDEEERLALKKAKEDDARELALENKLKREKEERRKKLQALADKQR